MKENNLMAAIPPEDFEGSIADWMTKLQERGLWNGEGWHGNIMISESDWWEILEECEGDDEDDIEDEDDDDTTADPIQEW